MLTTQADDRDLIEQRCERALRVALALLLLLPLAVVLWQCAGEPAGSAFEAIEAPLEVPDSGPALAGGSLQMESARS